jgi:hypothetical protein
MSWSAHLGPTPLAELKKSLKVLRPNVDGELHPDAEAQLELAKKTALQLATSGAAIGDPHSVYVTISGHCQPGHEQVDGESNSVVTITVSEATVSLEPAEVEDTSEQD